MPLMTPRNDRSVGFAVSCLMHAALFFAGGFVLIKPVEYAVEAGSGGIEVSLTAAPAESTVSEPAVQAPPEAAPAEVASQDAVETAQPAPDQIQEEKPAEQKVEEKKPPQVAADSPYKGDGSSAVPGKDKTTFYSAGGAVTEAKPNYLRNPAPAYPLEARQKGWQGTVILKVDVDKSGRPTHIEKEQSSGFGILDDSALHAVRKWKFMPAKIGGIPVESMVRVPVKFEIES